MCIFIEIFWHIHATLSERIINATVARRFDTSVNYLRVLIVWILDIISEATGSLCSRSRHI